MSDLESYLFGTILFSVFCSAALFIMLSLSVNDQIHAAYNLGYAEAKAGLEARYPK